MNLQLWMLKVDLLKEKIIYSKSNTSKVDSTESVLLEVFLCLSYAFLIGCEAIYFNMRTAVCMASTEICS